ncbi:oxidoreductase [Lithospermum erythrorhizon]|uniref:NADH-ubiquinone oxidoreductase chain 3 n=1 Tax=Lithospermum erythrorhizon TaxID=34254 RepID=A0AAV3QZ98_LITER
MSFMDKTRKGQNKSLTFTETIISPTSGLGSERKNARPNPDLSQIFNNNDLSDSENYIIDLLEWSPSYHNWGICVPFPFASNSSTYPEKLSAYECGFDPSGDARSRFDIRFYLVSILFIIPDPEVTFSFPWAVPPNKIDPFGFWSMMAFLLILTIGFLYEWKRGASDWE